MSRGKDLLKNTGILMIAKISTQIVSFLLLPLYTSLLSTIEYGKIDIYTSLSMIIIPFLTLQLEMGLFRFLITEKSEDNHVNIISTTFIIVIRILVGATIVYWPIAMLLNLDYALYLYLYYISMTISTLLLQVCRAFGNNKLYGFASFLSSAVSVFLNVLFIVGFNFKIEGILLSSIIAQLLSSFYIIIRIKIYKYIKFSHYDKKISKKLVHYSVPLIFNQVSSWAVNYSDRLIILGMWGTAANGIYSLANKFSNITNTFFNVFNIAWSENVVRSLEDKENSEYINKMFLLIFNVYLAIVTGIVNILPFFFSLMVNKQYNDAYGHIPILLLAMFFSGMAATIGSVYIAYSKTKEVSITTILAGICNIIVHLVLLKQFNLYAASISTLISFGLLFIYRYIFVKKFFDLKIDTLSVFTQLIIFIFAWVCYVNKNTLMIILGILVNLVYICFLIIKNRTIFIKLLKKDN